MVEARVLFVGHFGEAKVRTFAGVGRNDVIDNHCVVRGGNAAEVEKLRIGAKV
jgi:hypothetical protein